MYVDPFQQNPYYRYCPCCGRPMTFSPHPWYPKQYPDYWLQASSNYGNVNKPKKEIKE